MTPQQKTAQSASSASAGAGYRAAGLCGAQHPSGVLCTRRAGHSPGHANHYRGRKSVTDSVGLQW